MKSVLLALAIIAHPARGDVPSLDKQVESIHREVEKRCSPYESEGIYCPVDLPPAIHGDLVSAGDVAQSVTARAWNDGESSVFHLGLEWRNNVTYFTFVDKKPYGIADKIVMRSDIQNGFNNVKEADITHSSRAQETYQRIVENIAVSIRGGEPNKNFLKEDYIALRNMYTFLLK